MDIIQKEINLLNISADLWNGFNALEQYHKDDIEDFKYHIHALQNIIMAREFVRNNMGIVNTTKQSPGF